MTRRRSSKMRAPKASPWGTQNTPRLRGSPSFAKPILTHLRAVVHGACPDVVETIKWRMPSFEYKGLLCGMAAFKQHCTFGFWKHSLVLGSVTAKEREAHGSFGKLTSLSDLPPKTVLARFIKKAMQLNVDGVPSPRDKSKPKKAARMHPEFEAALARNRRALATFEGFSPSHRKEYVEWVAEAKREETRRPRIATAIEWMAVGRARNWKYMNC